MKPITEQPAKVEFIDEIKNPSDGKPIEGRNLQNHIAPLHNEPVPGLFPVGLTLLMGPFGSDLDTVSYHCTAKITNGQPIFDRYGTQPMRVGYQALAQDAIRASNTLKTLALSLGANLFNTVLIPGEKVFGINQPLRVQGYIQRKKLSVFFVNPIIKAMGIKVAGRFHSEYHYLSLLSQVAHQNGVAIVAVYHSTKRELDENVFASKALSAASDNILLLSNKYENNNVTYYTLQHYGRNFPKRTIYLESVGSRYNLTEIDELPKWEIDPGMKNDLVLLRSYGLTQAEMAQVMRISQGQVSKMLQEIGPMDQSEDSVPLDDIEYFESDDLVDSLEEADESELEDSDSGPENIESEEKGKQAKPEE